MLVPLDSNFVSDNWEVYGSMIEKSIVPNISTDDLIMTKVLHKILDGVLKVWIHTDEDNNPTSLLTTTVYEDSITEQRALLIYSAYGVNNTSKSIIQNAVIKLKEYARSKGCDSIIAFSNVRGVIEFCRVTGGNAEFSLLTWSL